MFVEIKNKLYNLLSFTMIASRYHAIIKKWVIEFTIGFGIDRKSETISFKTHHEMKVARKDIKDALVSKGLFLQGMYEKEDIDVLMSDKGKEIYDLSLPMSQEEYDDWRNKIHDAKTDKEIKSVLFGKKEV